MPSAVAARFGPTRRVAEQRAKILLSRLGSLVPKHGLLPGRRDPSHFTSHHQSEQGSTVRTAYAQKWKRVVAAEAERLFFDPALVT